MYIRLLSALSLALAVCKSLPALEWEDCGLQADEQLLKLLQYTHSPDPIEYGANSTISKRWVSVGSVSSPITNLTEHVVVARQRAGSTEWETYFENTFDVCDPRYHPGLCPIDLSKTGSSFSYTDHHPPSQSTYYPRFRAIEHYYLNGVYGGCASTIYSQSKLVRGTPEPQLTPAKTAAAPPNVLLIFIDDTGWGDYSFNDHKRTDTPHLQELASSGLTLTDFHAGCSVCTPSRASLLTGRLGARTGVMSNFSPFSIAGLPLNETTIAEVLKPVGYATAMAGKWHLGHRPPHSPIHRGFDQFLGLPMSHDYGCTNHPGFDISCPNRAQDVCRPSQPNKADPAVCHIGPNNPWNESIPLYSGDTIIEQPVDLTTLSDRYAEFAVSFIHNATQQNHPFFVYLPFNHMHVPVGNHKPAFKNTSRDRGVYGDTLRQLDSSIGKVVAGIKAAGVEENTLILLTGDNGAPSDQCEYGGMNGPYQGSWLTKTYGGGGTGKTTTWEGGHREPGLAVWPGRIRAGSRSGATVSALDMLPTIAALAGAPLPQDRAFDGVNLAPVLFEGAAEVHRPHGNGALFHPNSGCEGKIGVLETLRLRNFKAKWRTGGKCTSCDGKTAPDKYHDPPLLFDLDSDPGEETPLTASDARYTKLLAEVRAALAAIKTSIASDNTTLADYSQDHSVKPCCNVNHPLCMCTD